MPDKTISILIVEDDEFMASLLQFLCEREGMRVTRVADGRAAKHHMASETASDAVLLDLFNNVPPTPEQIRLTALAASSAGDDGDAAYYMGEYHIASGDLSLAIKQLELALAAPEIRAVQRARFEARMKEVQEALAESGRRSRRVAQERRPPG